MPFTENRLQNCRCHRPEKGPRPARLHATSPKTGPGAVWGELIRKRANLDARRAPDRRLSAQNVTCHQGPKLGPSERGYMQITEFEPLSHHRKLPNLGLHRMRDTKRLFGGPAATASCSLLGGPGLHLLRIRFHTNPGLVGTYRKTFGSHVPNPFFPLYSVVAWPNPIYPSHVSTQ